MKWSIKMSINYRYPLLVRIAADTPGGAGRARRPPSDDIRILGRVHARHVNSDGVSLAEVRRMSVDPDERLDNALGGYFFATTIENFFLKLSDHGICLGAHLDS